MHLLGISISVPAKPPCGENEVLSTCSNIGCFTLKTCNDNKTQYVCNLVGKCRPSCVCIDGYTKYSNNICELIDECPQDTTLVLERKSIDSGLQFVSP